MERLFNLKLLLPPRTCIDQVSSVKPQEMFGDRDGFITQEQGFNKCVDKEPSLPFSNTNRVLPTTSIRAETAKTIAVMPLEKEKTSLRLSQVYSKLFEEAEKIKTWKLKMDSVIAQKDRKLQENKKTTETQRKAIQELQFENESLSMKLEEQLRINEDLTNKNNATRSLCNILKDTFERTTEKMSLYEAEREETHNLFLQNHESIQKMIAAFKNLRIQAEAEQKQLSKVKEDLKHSEDLKIRLENEYRLKNEEVFSLQVKLTDKEKQHNEILLSFQEMKKDFSKLQDSAKQQQELLQTCKQEQNDLQKRLKNTEQLRLETEKTLTATLKQTKCEYAEKLQKRDIQFEEMNNLNKQFARQLEEMQVTTAYLETSLASERQRVQDLESDYNLKSEELARKNTELGEVSEIKLKCEHIIQTLKNEEEAKLSALQSLEEKIKADGEKLSRLSAEHEDKMKDIRELEKQLELAKTENKQLVSSLENNMNEQNLLKEQMLLKECKLQDIEGQLSAVLKTETESANYIKKIEKDVNEYKQRYDDLKEKLHQLKKKNDASYTKENKGDENIKIELETSKLEKQKLQNQLEILHAEVKDLHQQNENIQKELKESNKTSASKLTKKERQVTAIELKLTNLKVKLETKAKKLEESVKENKALKGDFALKHEECIQHTTEIIRLKENIENLKTQYKDEHEKIRLELKYKSESEAQLELQKEKLKQTVLEARKTKDDTELKCQQKISDMVALMEKHKHEYDKMVEEKDTELSEKRTREAEINACKTSLEFEISHIQVENEELKQQLKEFKTNKENLEKEVERLTRRQTSQRDMYTKEKKCLKQEILVLQKQIKSLENEKNNKVPNTKCKPERNSERETFSTMTSTQALSKKKISESPSKKDLRTECSILNTPSWTTSKTTSRIRSFRICTPPSTGKSAPWKESIFELDLKSDSSEQNDVLSFSVAPVKSSKQQTTSGKVGLKEHSSGGYKSPGAALKLAAMKRMRDAGWTTINNLKKKRVSDKIFA